MSSRSLAAARSRRAGENAPPVSGNRPGTSIGSHAAFAPQGAGYQQTPSNVRVGRGPSQPPPPPSPQQTQKSYQTGQNSQTPPSKPFSKLTIGQAIGLITIRLGQVEQWIIDTDESNENNEPTSSSAQPSIGISVISNIVNRIDTLEKSGSGSANNEELGTLTEEVSKLTQQLNKFTDEGNKHSLAISKHSEQLLRFERDLVETKDIMKTFMLRYDAFVTESSEKFLDFEAALTEVEKGLITTENELVEEINDEEINDEEDNITVQETGGPIESADLKSIVKLELANSAD